jgi:cytochrome c biogenesis protein CcmG/thiol:disulfide interchange protein DsbE
MKNFSSFVPLFILIFLVSVIGLSTYKISKKQEIETKSLSENFDERFSTQKILLPDFLLPDLFDEKGIFSKNDLKGQYSLINIFASWCTTCQVEHEFLMRMKDEINIYGVAWRDINQNTKKFLSQNGNPYKKVATDNQALLGKLIGIVAVPETLIIDREGNIVLRYRGNLEESSVEKILEFLRKAKVS